MRMENVEEKYIKLVDEHVENEIMKTWKVNVVIEVIEVSDESIILGEVK